MHRHRPGVQHPVRRIGRGGAAIDQRIGGDRDRLCAGIGDGLPHGEHILVVNRDGDAETLALAVRGVERDRLAGRQDGARGMPDRIGRGRHQPFAPPAEACEISARRAGWRQQAHRRRILVDRLGVFAEHQIVDPRALKVDRTLQRWRIDSHPWRCRQNGGAIPVRHGAVRGRLRGGIGQHLSLAAFDLCDWRVRSGRGRLGAELVHHQRPAEQDQHRDQREDHQIAIVLLHRSAASIMFAVRNRVVAMSPPRMAPGDASHGQPSAFHGAIAAKCLDCIGRTGRRIATGRRQDHRRPQLPGANDENEEPGDHRAILPSALSRSARNEAKSRSMPPARPIRI